MHEAIVLYPFFPFFFLINELTFDVWPLSPPFLHFYLAALSSLYAIMNAGQLFLVVALGVCLFVNFCFVGFAPVFMTLDWTSG